MTVNLKEIQGNLKIVDTKFKKKETQVDKLIADCKDVHDIDNLLKFVKDFERENEAVMAILQEAEGYQDSVYEVKNDMGECLIPENITKRANEIDTFKE